jgi:hypothetical protein
MAAELPAQIPSIQKKNSLKRPTSIQKVCGRWWRTQQLAQLPFSITICLHYAEFVAAASIADIHEAPLSCYQRIQGRSITRDSNGCKIIRVVDSEICIDPC